MSDQIRDLIDKSSFGTPEAKAARASVSDEHAARIVRRAEQLRQLDNTHRTIWFPPGSPLPAHADHPSEEEAHRHALATSRAIGDEVAVIELPTEESKS